MTSELRPPGERQTEARFAEEIRINSSQGRGGRGTGGQGGSAPIVGDTLAPLAPGPTATHASSAKPSLSEPASAAMVSALQQAMGPVSGHTAPSPSSGPMPGAAPSPPPSAKPWSGEYQYGPHGASPSTYAGWGVNRLSAGNAQMEAFDQSMYDPLGYMDNGNSWFSPKYGPSLPLAIQEKRDAAQNRTWAGRVAWGMSSATNAAHNFMQYSPSADTRFVGGLGGLAGSAGVMAANPFLAGAGMLVSGSASVVGGAQDFTYGKLVEQAHLERVQRGAMLSGADLSVNSRLVKEGVGLGYTQGESSWQVGQYINSIGAAGAGGLSSPLRYALGGVGTGAQAFFMQGGATGGGASTRNLQELESQMHGTIGVGYQGGLRGAGLERFVSRIAALMEGLAANGLKLDVAGTNQFLANSIASGVEAPQAGRAAQTFSGIAGEIQDDMMSPYKQLAKAGMFASLARNARTPLEMAKLAQRARGDAGFAHQAMLDSGLSQEALEYSMTANLGNTEMGSKYSRVLSGGTVTKAGDIMLPTPGILKGALGSLMPDNYAAFPAGGATPGSEMLAKTDLSVNQAVMKDFNEALKAFTAVMEKQGGKQAWLGSATAGIDGESVAKAALTYNPITFTAGAAWSAYDYLFGK